MYGIKVNLDSVNREDFSVSEKDGLTLIVPKKSKHVWEDAELHLRSLLLNHEGEVVSTGFPKFLNYSEHKGHTAKFEQAVREGRTLCFMEKRDGTLIIASQVDGKAHFRTRGSHGLGDFEAPVMDLIRNRYPKLEEFFNSDEYVAKVASFLFEYTAPDNQIVLRYDRPELTLLGAVSKVTLNVVDYMFNEMYSDWTGVPAVSTYLFDPDSSVDEILETVRGWKDEEGVVVSFHGAGDPGMQLLKIKADQYVRLHSLKFRLSGKVRKLAYLLGIEDKSTAKRILSQIGVDYEAQEFIRPELHGYLDERGRVIDAYNQLVSTVNAFGANCESRKDFVFRIRSWLEEHPDYSEKIWFDVAMRLFDRKVSQALASAMSIAVNENVRTIQQWEKDRMKEVDSMLSAPVYDDE